ncbi:MAG: hypothetical protein SOY37_09285 [Oscillospiraceae bacterium]|nr:hypothetical protein [Oscillospiraceae bacterium]
MKKKIAIVFSALLVLMIIGYCAFAHFNPYTKLVGTWTGDGTLDLLGNSPFDGATELTFFVDHTGYVVTEQGEISFTYTVQNEYGKWGVVILEDADEYTYGQRFYIDGKTLNIDRDGEMVSFIRK